MYDKNPVTHTFKTLRLTGSLMSFRHDGGRKLPLAAGKTPISCSSGLNCKQKKKLKDPRLLPNPKFYKFYDFK